MEQTNISQLDTITLKALAYDQISQIEISQNNLRLLNQELAKRQSGGGPPPIEPIPTGTIQRV